MNDIKIKYYIEYYEYRKYDTIKKYKRTNIFTEPNRTEPNRTEPNRTEHLIIY